MKRAIGFLAALTVLALIPSQAQAQRGRGNSNTITPYGTFNQAEMNAAGGNFMVAAQIREQQQIMQQQQQMMKEQQQYEKQMAAQQKAYNDYIKKHPEAARVAMPPVRRPAAKKKAAKADSKTAVGTTKDKDATTDADAKLVGPVAATPADAKAKTPGKIETIRKP